MSQPANVTPEARITPEASDTEASVTLDQARLAVLLKEATLPTVPDGVARYIAGELGYFSLKNSNVRTLNMSKPGLAPFILANRPELLSTLEGDELAVAVAKEFSRQIKEYASEHGLSSYPKRKGCSVTFRVCKATEKASESVASESVASDDDDDDA